VQATEGYGAKVVLHGSCYDDAYAKACEICETEGATFLHPYNDLEVIAGQGTLGLEILGDLPTVDMIIVPGDTTAETLSAIIADEAAIGMINSKTTACRLIPAIGKKAGDHLVFGGLLGEGPVMPVKTVSPAVMINRGGRIPSPIQSLKN
jgi:uncharacterized protein (UPF0210 family)